MATASYRSKPRCLANGKLVFRTKRKAQLAGNKVASQTAALKLRPYRCPVCGFWHLTKQPKAR